MVATAGCSDLKPSSERVIDVKQVKRAVLAAFAVTVGLLVLGGCGKPKSEPSAAVRVDPRSGQKASQNAQLAQPN